jgi:hypothetical protein
VRIAAASRNAIARNERLFRKFLCVIKVLAKVFISKILLRKNDWAERDVLWS